MNNFRQIDQQLTAWIDAHHDEILEKTRGILRIPSVKGAPEPGAPFGRETRRALDYALDVAAGYGLTTKNLDGYAAHAEWNAPDVSADAGIVGVLAHVDIVPAGDSWKHAPFDAAVDAGKIYARGVMDDKGPAMAGLFAIAAMKECGVPLTRRLRLILGADEESGGNFACAEHYFAHEEMPVTGFTPDATFPLVYAEKGIATIELSRSVPAQSGPITLLRLSGGERHNMVPDNAEALFEGAPDLWPPIQEKLCTVQGITAAVAGGGKRLHVEARGVSAHGATPDQGVNAVAVLCEALLQCCLVSDSSDLSDPSDRSDSSDLSGIIRIIRDWGQDTTGSSLGIDEEDEVSGHLTSNLGIVRVEGGQAHATINIRYPVTWALDDIIQNMEPGLYAAGFSVLNVNHAAPLYVPKEDPLIETLLSVYREETGDMTEPCTIGGGTYARVMKKGVAYGPSFPFADAGDGGPHEADECWPVAHLILATKIYAKALARLGNQ